MVNMNKIGKKILQLRKKNELTQSELANKLSVTSQAVSNWERGLSLPDIFNLKTISDLFNTSLDYFFTDTEEHCYLLKQEKELECDHLLYDYVYEIYKSRNIQVFSEIINCLPDVLLSKLFELAYKEGKLEFVSELVELVSQEDLKKGALYSYNNDHLDLFSEIVICLSSENINQFAIVAMQDKKSSFFMVLMECMEDQI